MRRAVHGDRASATANTDKAMQRSASHLQAGAAHGGEEVLHFDDATALPDIRMRRTRKSA
ncbi:hypothetical protein XcodCFBP4690_13440 [Xanthomonas codiaei]|uniref:Uncharacterized protein n=1 Tax=Xanthomonas codiaei TaxID=56463 RepID=A0A2S7CMB1_9XANT|nr:hypothetical protein XcodCFBP4690_13440 [Xanthomonas codiaei]